MPSNTTIIYYTANLGTPLFEENIRQRLRTTAATVSVPIISVSQQPIELGMNICVGNVGASAQNAWRQFEIGAAAAQTRFVCPAEADMLYPPEYFVFQPPRDDTYYFADPLWVLFAQRGYGKVFYRKRRGSESAMVVNRELLLRRFQDILGSLPEWGDQDADGDKLRFLTTRRRMSIVTFEVPTPIVTIKTDQQLHKKTPHDPATKTRELPPWGQATDLIREYAAA